MNGHRRIALTTAAGLALSYAVWLAPGIAFACSPAEPITIDSLTTMLVGGDVAADGALGRLPVGVHERLHYTADAGTPGRVTMASISAVTRYWGEPPTLLEEIVHGGLPIDETDTCGTPSGSLPGTYEYGVQWDDGTSDRLYVEPASAGALPAADLASLAALFGGPVQALDPGALLRPSMAAPSGPTAGIMVIGAVAVAVIAFAVVHIWTGRRRS